MDVYGTLPRPGGSSGGGGGATSSSTIQLLTTRYMKHSRSVGILWAVFTVCSAILNVVVFLQDEWVGDTLASKSPGHFGVWRFCTVLSGGTESDVDIDDDDDGSANVKCVGSFVNFSSILSPGFRAATVFVGLSVIVAIMCVVGLLLFCLMKSRSVFEICGTMQVLSGICMSVGILCFPAGWDNDHVRGICGAESDNYTLGDCGIRWAFVLAVVAVFDAWILGCLAFTLAQRTAKSTNAFLSNAESPYMNPGSIYKGEINSGFVGDTQSLAGSRKSLNIQPVVMMPYPSSNPMPPSFLPDGPPLQMLPPPPDVYAEFSHRNYRSNASTTYRNQSGNNQGGSSIQNFQL